ncbi:MAG TPA: hypothetical protein VL307_19040 [Chitinophagaceae bacterium]|nr:hypothetical protein [Chitinophagaceae bacterium]
MEDYGASLQDLYNSIPRRHSAENVVAINEVLNNYTTLLGQIEGINAWYETNTAVFYDSLETIRQQIKMSTSNKHAKKAKDALFDEASGMLKDDIQSLIGVLNNGREAARG